MVGSERLKRCVTMDTSALLDGSPDDCTLHTAVGQQGAFDLTGPG